MHTYMPNILQPADSSIHINAYAQQHSNSLKLTVAGYYLRVVAAPVDPGDESHRRRVQLTLVHTGKGPTYIHTYIKYALFR